MLTVLSLHQTSCCCISQQPINQKLGLRLSWYIIELHAYIQFCWHAVNSLITNTKVVFLHPNNWRHRCTKNRACVLPNASGYSSFVPQIVVTCETLMLGEWKGSYLIINGLDLPNTELFSIGLLEYRISMELLRLSMSRLLIPQVLVTHSSEHSFARLLMTNLYWR
jgi:hypothetical protein